MKRLYEYEGNIRTIKNLTSEIELYVYGNDAVSPIRLSAPKALFEYICKISGGDSEEKYMKAIYNYSGTLLLYEIVIKGIQTYRPAKIITQAKLTSVSVEIFGNQEPLECCSPMSDEECARYHKFRYDNRVEDFYKD